MVHLVRSTVQETFKSKGKKRHDACGIYRRRWNTPLRSASEERRREGADSHASASREVNALLGAVAQPGSLYDGEELMSVSLQSRVKTVSN